MVIDRACGLSCIICMLGRIVREGYFDSQNKVGIKYDLCGGDLQTLRHDRRVAFSFGNEEVFLAAIGAIAADKWQPYSVSSLRERNR